MYYYRTLLALIALILALPAFAAIRSDGILGNSGEEGDTLVRFAPEGAAGMGVAYDRFGSLWDRAGDGQLNSYAVDGRMLATYKIPRGNAGWNNQHQLALVGDLLVLCMQGQLYTLPITAPAGTEALLLKCAAERISFNAVQGKLAIYNKGTLSLLDPATCTTTPVCEVTGGVNWMDMDADGAIYTVGGDWKLHKFVAGKEITDGWPKAAPGERPQVIDDAWFGHTWHGTIKRFTTTLEPNPGVVLGGASGSFIGHLDQNSELNKGCGMAKIRDDLYAVSGLGGILQLLKWDNEKRQMTVIRRIGSISGCQGLGLDRAGNVWWNAGSWKWNDTPDAPLRNGVNSPDYPGVSQIVMLDNDMMVGVGWLWGSPTFYTGRLTGEVAGDRRECTLAKNAVGSAVYRQDGQLTMLVVNKTGGAAAYTINNEGRFVADNGAVTLTTTITVKEWTTLAMQNADTLLGAADGQVIVFARDGKNWKETRRWQNWGAADTDKFGSKIYLTSDAGRLWVSDRERHRVLAFNLADEKLIATFGTTDTHGDDMMSLTNPEVIAARDNRAVVYDQGNQRLVKLVIE